MSLNIPIQLPRLITAGAKPATNQLLEGQIAVNLPDRKFFVLDHTGAIQQVGVALTDLAPVAQTGNYNDLINKPNISSEYVLPAATAAALGGVMIPANHGLAVDSSGNLTNSGVYSVNSRVGAVTLVSTDVGIPTDLLSGASGTLATKYLPPSLSGALNYQSAWNASTNTPTLASGVGTKGNYYVVDVAGSTNLDGISSWNVGDWAIFDGTVWERLANASGAVLSVNGLTGTVVLTASNISGLATVATSGAYGDLTGKPTPYSLPIATTALLGGVVLTTTAKTAGNVSTGQLATVAVTGSYTDLLNGPVNSPDNARISASIQGSPNILNEAFYIFSQAVQFPQNFANSQVFATLVGGTTATIRIMQYPKATPTTGTQVGTINIDTVNGNTLTSTGSTTTYAIGDQLSFQFATTNVARFTATLAGTWQ